MCIHKSSPSQCRKANVRVRLPLAIVISFLLAGVTALGQSRKADGARTDSDLSKEAFVIEKLHTVATFENDGTSSITTAATVHLQSEAGVQRWGVLSRGFSVANERVEIGYVRVRKKDGSVVETAADTAHDVTSEIMRAAPMYTDYQERHIAVKGLGVGDVLEYQVTVRTQVPLVPGQFWYAYDFDRSDVSLDEQVQVNVPRDRELKMKSADLKPDVVEAGNRRTYTWKSANRTSESTVEPRREFPAPAILLSTFKSWDEVGRWWNGLEQPGVTPTPEIRAKAAELTHDAKTRNEKIHALYNYVSTRFHYISISFGIGRYQPHAAAEVLKNEYGDCKDKYTLLASLLQAVGIEAYPALMNSTRHIDPDVPSPGQFDHVISAVPDEGKPGKLEWLDTTAEISPFGFLVFQLRDKQALVVPSSQPAMLATTPADPPFKNFRRFETIAKLSDSGVLEGKMIRSYRGDSEVIVRAVFRQFPQSQWKDVAQGLAQGMGFAGDVSEVDAGSPEDTSQPFEYSNKYTRKDYPDWPNRRILPPLGLVGLRDLQNSEERTLPILLGGREEIIDIARVELPQGYAPRLLPNVDEVRDFAEYHSSYAFKDGIFTAEVHIFIKQSEVPLSALKDYQSLQKAINDDLTRYTELVPGTTAIYAPSSPASQEAVELFNEAHQAALRHDLSGTLNSLQRAVKIDSRFKEAWAMLGAIELSTGQTEDGLAALQKAVSIDPKDSRITQMVSATYVKMNRTDDAVALWRDVLKQDPDNVDAHANLGNLLLSRKKYTEAVPELEAAAGVDKPTAAIRVSLANAYIGAGSPEKAEPLLKKVAEVSFDDVIWNDCAWALADNHLDLSTAQRYAEKAVRSVEDDTVHVRLEKLQSQDLGRMIKLAMFWDTLGWVYFREGNLPQAQDYLEAAWNLEQSRDHGEHLAELYERQGKKALAAHQRALAYALTGAADAEPPPALAHRSGGTPGTTFQHMSSVEELSEMRHIKLGKLPIAPGSAEFFVLIGSGDKAEDTRFISGDESMRSQTNLVLSIKFKAPIPQGSPAKLVRRGLLMCVRGLRTCDFTLLPVETVYSVN